jgi:hypothetical protein
MIKQLPDHASSDLKSAFIRVKDSPLRPLR